MVCPRCTRRRQIPLIRAAALAIALFVALFVVGIVTCSAQTFEVEVTVGSPDAAFSSDAAWGWWRPAKYGAWSAEADNGADIVDARVVLPGETYSVLLSAERCPTLEATGLVIPADSAPSLPVGISLEIEAYDLALAQHLALVRGGRVSPWLGATYMRIDEVRQSTTGVEEAESRLFGAAAGLDASVPIAQRLSVAGRLVGRWARGPRDARILPPDPGGAPVEASRIEVSDSTSRTMLGAELGLRLEAMDGLLIEAGWRYRDWSLDEGPATFDGPFARLILRL